MESQSLRMKCLLDCADTKSADDDASRTSSRRRRAAKHRPWFRSQSMCGDTGMIGEEIAHIPSETDQLREQLLRAQRLSSVGTPASSVAHEFNNIQTTVMNSAKLGMRPDSSESSRVQAFEKILK